MYIMYIFQVPTYVSDVTISFYWCLKNDKTTSSPKSLRIKGRGRWIRSRRSRGRRRNRKKEKEEDEGEGMKKKGEKRSKRKNRRSRRNRRRRKGIKGLFSPILQGLHMYYISSLCFPVPVHRFKVQLSSICIIILFKYLPMYLHDTLYHLCKYIPL